ncbi:MAG: phosphoribosylamine--glycine ligase [Candidatus Gastranaerophilales bacterium]|nr:phosphoribosylamine--glycine ligase [Candidatus Gastranaerophilales bacterium]
MRALVVGNGAREHALAWKLLQSPKLEKLYLWGANDGFSDLGEVVEADSFEHLAGICIEKKIDIVIVGPEKPLADGLADVLSGHGVICIGANKYWAQLESSKVFAKDFCVRHSINTAKYEIIKDQNILPNLGYPLVLKADGLCAGKGVSIAEDEIQAQKTIQEYLDGKFGDASKTIVAEEFLSGQEFSLISLFDGETLLPFVCARDFKKLQNGDKGPNTGGMGAFCPVALTDEQKDKLDIFVDKLKSGLLKEKAGFVGVIYSGLIWAKDDFYLLEFNMRFGDPETQALMMHLESDILEVFELCAKKRLKEVVLSWKKGYSGCLTIATQGYPYDYPKEIPIKNISSEVEVFYAGVLKNPTLKSFGGRVLSFCATGDNPYAKIYKAAAELEFEKKYYRTDINIC